MPQLGDSGGTGRGQSEKDEARVEEQWQHEPYPSLVPRSDHMRATLCGRRSCLLVLDGLRDPFGCHSGGIGDLVVNFREEKRR